MRTPPRCPHGEITHGLRAPALILPKPVAGLPATHCSASQICLPYYTKDGRIVPEAMQARRDISVGRPRPVLFVHYADEHHVCALLDLELPLRRLRELCSRAYAAFSFPEGPRHPIKQTQHTSTFGISHILLDARPRHMAAFRWRRILFRSPLSATSIGQQHYSKCELPGERFL